MDNWRNQLKFDPLSVLLVSNNKAIAYSAKYDLLDDRKEPVETLWGLKPAEKIVQKQNSDGSWTYPGGKLHVRSQQNYNQLETFRNLGELVEKYKFNRNHPAIEKAASFLFDFQTDEGDFRGIYGNQYSPNYSAAIMELLNKSGYYNDRRIKKGFEWLLSIRQSDGGWAIPIRTVGLKLDTMYDYNSQTIRPDISKSFSHMVTGVVLRGFASHSVYKQAEEAKKAGELLISRFFEPDKYPDRKDRSFWTKFPYPFWFTDLISALDSLSLLGFTVSVPKIQTALNWFTDRQQSNGSWELKLLKTKDKDLPQWISLAICRILKRFYG
ncbi:MAG: hypothetical protein ACFFD4_17455 [Candidatus Odinarchaeota archaeon]